MHRSEQALGTGKVPKCADRAASKWVSAARPSATRALTRSSDARASGSFIVRNTGWRASARARLVVSTEPTAHLDQVDPRRNDRVPGASAEERHVVGQGQRGGCLIEGTRCEANHYGSSMECGQATPLAGRERQIAQGRCTAVSRSASDRIAHDDEDAAPPLSGTVEEGVHPQEFRRLPDEHHSTVSPVIAA